MAVIWSDDDLAMLGVRPDDEVAELMDISPTTVRSERRKRGLPPARVHRNKRWTPEMLLDLAKLRDAQMVAKYGLTLSQVRYRRGKLRRNVGRHRRWTPFELACLDVLSDREVANLTGRSIRSIRAERLRIGPPVLEEF